MRCYIKNDTVRFPGDDNTAERMALELSSLVRVFLYGWMNLIHLDSVFKLITQPV